MRANLRDEDKGIAYGGTTFQERRMLRGVGVIEPWAVTS